MKKFIRLSVILLAVLMLQGNTSVVSAAQENYVYEAYATDNTLPAKYDLRDEDRMTLVRNQGSEGYCWAFASNAGIESNILSQPELAKKAGEGAQFSLNLSKTGTAWFIMTGISDTQSPYYNDYYNDIYKGSKGGNSRDTASGLNAGFGTYPEEVCPYDDIANGYSEELRFYSDYRLKDYNQLSNDIDTVKRNIIDNGAVSLGFSYVYDGFSKDNKTSYYADEELVHTSGGIGHEVIIAGWDDNYSKENFTGAVMPKNDGAWLCKNSWGDGYGDNGYIWISYESVYLEYSQFIMQDNSAYDNEYQHGYYYGYSAANVPKAANIYTAESDEILTQISISTISSYNYDISVYRLNDSHKSPEDGELLTSIKGKCDYSGIHYIDIPETKLNAGDIFSVVVTADENSYLVFDGLEDKKHTEGKGYYYIEGWKDSADIETQRDLTGTIGYPSIKAFTKNKDNTKVRENLKNIVNQADDMLKQGINPDIPQEYKWELVYYISNAKSILDNQSACAADINNAGYLINYYMSKIDSYVYNINSTDDYYRLIDLLKTGGNIPYVIELNTDLDFQMNINSLAIDNNDKIAPLATSRGEFTGVFNGNGHTIKNVSLSTINYSLGKKSAFFGDLKNARISDVTFENIVCDNEDMAFAAIVSERIYSSTINNVSVKNCSIKMNTSFKDVISAGITNYAFDSSYIGNCSLENNDFYGNVTVEVARAYNSTLTSNVVNNNHICAYSYISVYNADDTSTDYMVSPRYIEDNTFCYNKNIIIEKYDGDIRFRIYTDKVNSIECEIPYTKRGDYYYIDSSNASNGLYIQVNLNRDANNMFRYAVDVNTQKAWITGTESDAQLGNKVVIPDIIDGMEVTGIGHGIFYNYSMVYEITELLISDNIKYIYSDSIAGLFAVEKLTIGDGITSIPEYFFTEKGNLTTIILGKNVGIIDKMAFMNNYALTSLYVYDRLKYIGANAFENCTNLTEIKYSKDISEWSRIQIEEGNDILAEAKIEFTHSWSDSYKGCDEHGHWRICTNEGCNEIADYHIHTPGAAADKNHPCVCTECGYIIEPAISEDVDKPSDKPATNDKSDKADTDIDNVIKDVSHTDNTQQDTNIQQPAGTQADNSAETKDTVMEWIYVVLMMGSLMTAGIIVICDTVTGNKKKVLTK